MINWETWKWVIRGILNRHLKFLHKLMHTEHLFEYLFLFILFLKCFIFQFFLYFYKMYLKIFLITYFNGQIRQFAKEFKSNKKRKDYSKILNLSGVRHICSENF